MHRLPAGRDPRLHQRQPRARVLPGEARPRAARDHGLRRRGALPPPRRAPQIRIALFLAPLCLAHVAFAQQYPNKPLHLIAPFAPGGALDLIARGVGAKLSESVGQPVVVENRAGASGAIGSEAVARSAPDGYTILLGATTTHGINPAFTPQLLPSAPA